MTVPLTLEHLTERLLELDTLDSTFMENRALEIQRKGSQARALVLEYAERYRANPDALEGYFRHQVDERETGEFLLSGFATSVYYEIMKNIDEDRAISAIQDFANGGWAATITTQKEGLMFFGYKLRYAEIKEGTLCRAKLFLNSGDRALYRKGSVFEGVFDMSSGNYSRIETGAAKNAKFLRFSGKEAILEEGVFENIVLDKPQEYVLHGGMLLFKR